MPDRHLIDVHLLLIRGEQVLLSRRRDPIPAFDGQWHLPSGKLDAGESVLAAAAREALEEVGVRIDQADLSLVHTRHVTASGLEPRLGLFFATTRWAGEPVNREPAKCSELGWFELRELPTPLIEYSAGGIRGYLDGTPFGLAGWPNPKRL
ncbi:8-oxo-dGTP pyrophosphatase MutT (NUDIX family) [Kutzneria viridogrisea]|uniref:8-oxo-dGTP pyrophosphatase MutT (NUDIX family) n=1 Tax=Kutzneria viridogrisea TaxID=47990 RepID=A0ABR6BNJ0_9PSEU|nr:NUDIX domain-containing protein [Kutzneria albida]MBA8928428.1 8-oxo-dGTP pyrophosphatase MutT (NUDIX family) [Kutzneria viridogrisea]